jgi:hypothetical protein
MKRLIVSCMVAFTALVIGGCALPKPEFNQAYLPNAVPGSPQKRIDLPRYVTDKASVKKWGLFGKSTTCLPASLYWVEEDNLLFNISREENKSVLHSFLIIPSTGEIKLLEGAEMDALLSNIEKGASVASTKTAAGKTAQVITSILVGLAGKDAKFEEPYKGRIENNGTILDFDIKMKEKWAGFSSTDYDVAYAIKNKQTGNTVSGHSRVAFKNENEVENELKTWLKSWRVSPDGRYYLIGKTVTVVDSIGGAFTTLIENYEHAYAGLDISPRWDRIALLIIKQDGKTKQMNYWIEFYPFDYRNNNEEASTR